MVVSIHAVGVGGHRPALYDRQGCDQYPACLRSAVYVLYSLDDDLPGESQGPGFEEAQEE